VIGSVAVAVRWSSHRGEGDVRRHLNAGVRLAVDDGPRPRPRIVEGYRRANLAPVQVVDPGQSAAVDQSVSVVAKTDACVV
jgi:hypothetical protein